MRKNRWGRKVRGDLIALEWREGKEGMKMGGQVAFGKADLSCN